LKLRGIRTHQPVRVELENIYITLNTTASPRERFAHPERSEAESKDTLERKARDTALHELMRESARLVILGAPGSGKSTFLAYLALTYARGRDQVKARLDLDEARIPVFIPLRDFALALDGATGIPALFAFLDQHLADAGLDFPKNYFEPDCAAGNCLFLFDGVDEVVDETKRALAAEVIEQLAQTFPQNRIVVTSRPGGYRGAAQLSAAFQIATVREFDDEQIEKFVENWCVAVETAQAAEDAPAIRRVAETAARDLIGAIQGNPRVRALAVNPLLLTVIALVHRYRATLPERRAELYDECTDVLLGYWDLGKTGVAAKMLAAYTGLAEKMDTGERRAFLEPVALAFQEAGKVELDEDEVLNALSAQFLQAGYDRDAQRARQDAQRFLEIVSLRSGLLQERAPRVYAFSHLTFQEYLAARLVAERDDFVAYLLARVDDSWWREVILLAAGHLSASGKARATRLVRALLDHNTPAANILAGQALIDIGRFRIDGHLQNDAIEKLLPTMQNARLDVKTRASAGETLDALGWLPPDLDAFVPIRNQVSSLRGNLVSWIAKYPVTYFQFQKFIDAGGYANEKFWRDQIGFDEIGREKNLGDEAWKWLQQAGGAERRPWYWDNPRFHRAGYPVIGVTWYEASAYCRWLTEQFQIADFRLQIGNSNLQLPTSKLQFRLPTEAEWVRAAGGDANNRAAWDKPGESTGKLPAEKCQEIVLARANVKESDLGGTTPVAMYPDGKRVTEDGDAIWDLQGNAWEWTSNLYEVYPGAYIRGGSWYNSAGEISVTSRDHDYRDHYVHVSSFRVFAQFFPDALDI
jgi:formylglycine-generating enzyme required for sulfatase activity/energy-coupling factor transporter ATP-binding protein EcfA2